MSLLLFFIFSWGLVQTELMDSTMGYIAHLAIHQQPLRIRPSSCAGMGMAMGPHDLIPQQRHRQSHLEEVTSNYKPKC